MTLNKSFVYIKHLQSKPSKTKRNFVCFIWTEHQTGGVLETIELYIFLKS